MAKAPPKSGLVPEFYVDDPTVSREFYVDILGFEVMFERPEEGFLYLRRESAELMLDTIVLGRTWLTGPLEKPYGRGVNVQIWTTDVDALYARVQKTNRPVFLALEEQWYRIGDHYGGNRQFVIQDPDGYLLRFAQDLGTQWETPAGSVRTGDPAKPR